MYKNEIFEMYFVQKIFALINNIANDSSKFC